MASRSVLARCRPGSRAAAHTEMVADPVPLPADPAWSRWPLQFEDYDYARALERTEPGLGFLRRLFGAGKKPAPKEKWPAGPGRACHPGGEPFGELLRLFAPFMPFVTEEVWSRARSTGPPTAPCRAVGPSVYGRGELLASVARQVKRK